MDEWKDRQIIYFNFLHLVIVCLHVSLCIKVHVKRSEDKFGGVSPFFHPADSRDQTEDCGYLCLLRCLSSSLCLSNVDPPLFSLASWLFAQVAPCEYPQSLLFLPPLFHTHNSDSTSFPLHIGAQIFLSLIS